MATKGAPQNCFAATPFLLFYKLYRICPVLCICRSLINLGFLCLTVFEEVGSYLREQMCIRDSGIITKSEYSNDSSVVLKEVVHPGDTMEVKVLKVNDGEGQVILTYKRLEMCIRDRPRALNESKPWRSLNLVRRSFEGT